VAAAGTVGYAAENSAAGRCRVTAPSTAIDLDDLLRRTGAADEDAFEALYRAAAPALLGLITRKIGARDLAEEVLQEAFMRIWRNAARYDATLGSAIGWMRAVARNTAIDRLRQRRREVPRAELPDDPEELDRIAEAAADPLRVEETRAILTCLEALEDTPRRAIVLSYCYGYTHDELAVALGLPLGTVKSTIRRALPTPRACLEP
jgi:RNA polymerase sigma-70 factor (ECF subfamily)